MGGARIAAGRIHPQSDQFNMLTEKDKKVMEQSPDEMRLPPATLGVR